LSGLWRCGSLVPHRSSPLRQGKEFQTHHLDGGTYGSARCSPPCCRSYRQSRISAGEITERRRLHPGAPRNPGK
jgi:hypothetical protein